MQRGFPDSEFQRRTEKAQALMKHAGLAALLLTTDPNIRYFSGFLTRFWESPTRPWFLIIPHCGKPIAVIPAIGRTLMGSTWIDDIRTWSSPDLVDDGVSLLIDALREVAGKEGRVGVPDGHESHLRMPLADFRRVEFALGAQRIIGDDGIVRTLRMVKSDAEIAKIEQACAIAGRAFERVPEIASVGTPLDQIFRHFQMMCLEEGADWVPYLAGAAEQAGYGDVISPAHDRPLQNGDVLMMDTGVLWDGYFCDYDRNWSIGTPSPAVRDAHIRLIAASDAAFAIAKPGQRAADLYRAMADIVGGTDTGRVGHGLGLSLTEWPSLIPDDRTVLEPGMVLTLEPGIAIGDKVLVNEENIVVTKEGARALTVRQGREIRVL